jgi:hypothetical protein
MIVISISKNLDRQDLRIADLILSKEYSIILNI